MSRFFGSIQHLIISNQRCHLSTQETPLPMCNHFQLSGKDYSTHLQTFCIYCKTVSFTKLYDAKKLDFMANGSKLITSKYKNMCIFFRNNMYIVKVLKRKQKCTVY